MGPRGGVGLVKVKVKVKLSQCFNWAPRHEGLLGEWSYSSTHSCRRHWMEVGGQLHALANLPQEKSPWTHLIGGWVGDMCSYQESDTGIPAWSQSQILTNLLTYLLTYLLTPWCRVLFEKLIVTQLVKKYPAFSWNPNVHYRVHTSPPLDPILSQLNPARPIDPYLPKVHLNFILSLSPRSSQWSLDFGPPNQNPVNISSL
jgi:hypothetical protein